MSSLRATRPNIPTDFKNIPVRDLLVLAQRGLPGRNSRLKVIVNLLQLQPGRFGDENNRKNDEYDG